MLKGLFNPSETIVKSQTTRPSDLFNDENSNTSANPYFEEVLGSRLTRRSLFRGAGLTATALGATAVTGCATTGSGGSGASVDGLGFKPVAKSTADKVSIPEGYTAQIIYALGDPLAAGVPAYKNDGTDTAFEQRAGDHHDGMEWFGLDAAGKPSDSFNTRGILGVNHEATTDEKLASFFIHANGGASTLPRPASEVDKELAIHGLSFVEVQASGKQWAYKPTSPFNRRITAMTTAASGRPTPGTAPANARARPPLSSPRTTVA